ncbi:MAG TPA: aldo/keto reductase, partial [Agromyces sp.]
MPHPIPRAPLVPLADGHAVPQLGYGLYKVPADDAARLAGEAIAAGYRHLDTAAFYANERGTGEAVRAAEVPRDELFVTSKVWKDDNGYDETLHAFDATMRRLALDRLDLYLIHWPVPSTDRYVET